MKLYFSPGACSLAPHIVLREAGLPFSLEKVDLGKHTTAAGADFYGITAKGQVPLLQLDDGQVLSEGPVICQYVADQAGNSTLLPAAGTMARYRVMEWQNFLTSEMHKSFSPLFNPAVDAAGKAVFSAALRKKFEWIDSRLSDFQHLTGKDFTVADAYLFAIAGWSKFVNLDISDLKHLQRALQQTAERPAVQAALRAEGLIS
jgi:glutathione S-transferase